MMRSRILFALAVIFGALSLSATPSYGTGMFTAIRGRTITGEGGEAQLFSAQIICGRTKFTGGTILTIIYTSKIEARVEYSECFYHLEEVENFSSPMRAFNINRAINVPPRGNGKPYPSGQRE